MFGFIYRHNHLNKVKKFIYGVDVINIDDKSALKIDNKFEINSKNGIIYFKPIPEDISFSIIANMENDLNCNIVICSTWSDLIMQLSMQSTNSKILPLVLFDISIFEKQNATISEIISMISTLHICLSNPEKMKFAVVIEKSCNLALIKSLQDSEISGLVPCCSSFSYDKTIEALRKIMKGENHWPRDIIDIATNVDIKAPNIKGSKLTVRQHEVLLLVCNRGLSNKKIAAALKITESTVKIHVSAILKIYGVRNRTQLALAASSSLKA